MYNKLLTEAEIDIEIDYRDGEIYSDIEFHIARVTDDCAVTVSLNVAEAKRVAKQLDSFVTRAGKRMVTAKVRAKKIRAK